jgi:type I restriction enzyme, S subunit
MSTGKTAQQVPETPDGRGLSKTVTMRDGFLDTLPKSWTFDRLKDVVSLRNEKSSESSEAEDYLELEDLESGTGRILNRRNTLEVESAVTLFKKGDVLFGKLRPYLEKYYLAKFDGKCTGEILAFNPERVSGNFLQYCIGSRWFIERCNTLAYGAKMPRVNWTTQLAYFNIPLPPPTEQERIAAYLDASCAAIDAAVSAKQRQIEILDMLMSSILLHALTGGLCKNAETQNTNLTILPRIPIGWRLERLKDIATVRYGLGQPPAELDSGIAMIRATDVDAGHIHTANMMRVDPLDIPADRNPYLKTGEIIVVRSGAYTGDSAIVPAELEGCIAGYDMVVTVKRASAHFVAYCLLSRYVLESQILLLTLRAAQPHLNAEELGSVLLVLPPTRAEQDKIVAFLDKKLAEVKKTSEGIKSQIVLLSSFRKSLIHECVTGQRRISESDLKKVKAYG